MKLLAALALTFSATAFAVPADQPSCDIFGTQVYCGYNCSLLGTQVFCGTKANETCQIFGTEPYCGVNCKVLGTSVYCGDTGLQRRPAVPAHPAQ